MSSSEVPQTGAQRLLDHLRALGVFLTVGLAVAALYPFPTSANPRPDQWWLLLGSFVSALLWQFGLRHGISTKPVERPVGRARRVGGILIALAGAAVWQWATHSFYLDWNGSFDRSWLAWVAGTILIGVGLDLATGYWRDAQALSRSWRLLALISAILLLAGIVRLGMIATFPGPAGITQIEDLQFGNWGAHFLAGQRRRWEFIGHAWVSAVGIKLGGPTLYSVRSAYAVVGTLTVAVVFLWLRSTAGMIAALIGTAFMIVSSWDGVISRIGFNPDVLVVALVLWLMMGPGRRGRPSAYAAMGLLCGYILWEYIAYRPVAVFALLGGTFYSLRDKGASWALRLGRPALIVALMVCVAIPLFGNRIKGRVANEYLNGLNRARAVKSYYNESYSWEKTLELRLNRSLRTAGLFFFQGDGSGARNIGYRPLVDPASAVLGTIGFAYCLANLHVPIFGLFAAAFVLTTIGAMIVTADFNVLRMSVTIPYFYFFVGLAGLSIYRVWGTAWRRFGQALAALLLLGALGWSSYANLTFLWDYWTSPEVKRIVHSDLANLCSWLGENVDEGEQVVGAAHRNSNALIGSDAAWLRGGPIPGILEWDIETALRQWSEDGPTALVAYTNVDTEAAARFLEYILPGVEMTVERNEFNEIAQLAYAHLPGRPEQLDRALETWNCRGIAAKYIFRGEGKKILRTVDQVAPIVGYATFPTEIFKWFHRGKKPRRLGIEYAAEIRIEKPGTYTFVADVYGGTAEVRIGGNKIGAGRRARVELDPGVHRFDVTADMQPWGGGLKSRLLWQGPDSGGVEEPIPFYRIGRPLGLDSDDAAMCVKIAADANTSGRKVAVDGAERRRDNLESR